MKPKVSVIVPIYNTEKYLSRCLDSILNNTYDNMEIILINDGSTDLSENICKEYAKTDGRIILYNQNNLGISAARNKGLDICTGNYIFFVDSDDTICKNTIEECVRLIEEENADMLIGGYYGIGTKGYLRWSEIPTGVKCYTGIELLEHSTPNIPFGYVWTNLYKSTLWKNVRFPEGKIYEDSWTFPEVVINANKIVTYPGHIYNYYENNNSIMHSKMSKTNYEMRLDLYSHLTNFYTKHKLYRNAGTQIVYFSNMIDLCKKNKICINDSYYKMQKKLLIKYILNFKYSSIKKKLRFIIARLKWTLTR